MPDLHKIHGAGKHLLQLINDILDLSKVEAGKMDLYLETFAVRGMLEDVVSTIQPLVAQKHNTLVVDCPDDVGTMHADMTKLRQSLFNLLSNASKFTDSGTVTLRVADGGDGRAALDPDGGAGQRHRDDAGTGGPALSAVHAGRRLHDTQVRRHRPGPDHHQAVLPS